MAVDRCFLQSLVYEGTKVEEEFVETEYYKDLVGVGKQHHTVTLPAGSLRFPLSSVISVLMSYSIC